MKQSIDQHLDIKGRKDQGEVTTPTPLAQLMVDQLPEDVFISDSTTFLDPSFGTGTFLKVLARKLHQYGHSKENIESRLFGIETNRLYIHEMECLKGFNPTVIHHTRTQNPGLLKNYG
jgi:type I restriction-modification system DNA methylase subunit